MFLGSQDIISDQNCGLKSKGNEVYFSVPWEFKTMQNSAFHLFSKYPLCFYPQDAIFIYYVTEQVEQISIVLLSAR